MPINDGGRIAILGLEYQILYGLHLLMNSDRNIVVYIENFDDLSLVDDGNTTLLQLKTSQTPKIINDHSLEFWNSLRNWSYNVKHNNLLLSNGHFILITMNKVDEGTILHMLKPDVGDYNNAYKKIHELGPTAGNKTIRENYYPEFQQLERESQIDLIKKISVLDNAPSMSDIKDRIKTLIKGFTEAEFVDLFYTDLLGWWHDELNERLDSNNKEPITWDQLTTKRKYLRNKYNKQILLQTVLVKDIVDSILPSNDSIFIKQMKIIDIDNEDTIRDAKLDYQSTKKQNDLWIEQNESYDENIQKFRTNVVQQNYNNKFNFEKNNVEQDPKLQKKWGKNMYNWAMYETPWKISEFTEESYKRGVLHGLSETTDIGWHPFYKQKLDE